jgi:single-stranded-DNA-specific exonuclease
MRHRLPLLDRTLDAAAFECLLSSGQDPLLAQLLARRGVKDPVALDRRLTHLPPPSALLGAEEAFSAVGQAIRSGQRMLIVGDYDADGATATAVLMRGLARLGAAVRFLVPDRMRMGYGLTPLLAEKAAEAFDGSRPDWLITVDNGISSLEGVRTAQALGMKVLVTDHHLPGPALPDCLILNPHQPGCAFPSKHLAGVAVAFYLVMGVRGWLARSASGHFSADPPRIDDLLGLVALGTVADLVRLDDTNRRLVQHGLARIRRGQAGPGITALLQVAGRQPESVTAADLGFALGPRINAAGRLSDMTLGMRCLITDDPGEAQQLAAQLDSLNETRRQMQAESQDQALAQLVNLDAPQDRFSVVLTHPDWHPGVVGLVASRIKDRVHRPTLVFAADDSGSLRGSGRSIPGVHLRDTLEFIHSRQPGLITTFGGHAMAAGLTIPAHALDAFARAFEQAVQQFCDPELLEPRLLTDGCLAAELHQPEVAERLEDCVWGQGFPPPLFRNQFQVRSQRRLKDRHLKVELRLAGLAQPLEGIWFDGPESLGPEAELAYELGLNRWNGMTRVQLLLRAEAG